MAGTHQHAAFAGQAVQKGPGIALDQELAYLKRASGPYDVRLSRFEKFE